MNLLEAIIIVTAVEALVSVAAVAVIAWIIHRATKGL